MNTPISGNKYFLLFVDDFSRKMWVYFLKQKLNAFPIFQQFKDLVEKEFGFPIHTLRTDNGGNFVLLLSLPFVLLMALDVNSPHLTPLSKTVL